MIFRLRSAHARAWYAAAAYTVIALGMTWPLAKGLARDVAWDLGDPVLNIWILSWDCEQLRGILAGYSSHLRHFFDANIFHPAPLTLAYSEHLVPQAVQIFPVYALTGNPILCYNLLFLSTFVLSGLGMFLFARELTGSTVAAFVGGLLFAFAPYRVPQASHLQVLSSQWMPFALYGFRRYFEGGRTRALAGATAAIVLQALSCGYYLLYFSPFAALYAAWEMWRTGRLRDRRTWLSLTAAAATAALVLAPFVLPYVRVSQGLELSRTLGETTRLSADVYSYATASVAERFWGSRLSDVFQKPEGELFPGAVPLLLASIGLLWSGRARVEREPASWRTRAAWLLWAAAAVHVVALASVILYRRLTVDLWLFDVRLGNATQLLLRAALGCALALALSRTHRAHAAAFMRSRGFFVAALLAAMWLSLGPSPQALGRPFDLASPYRFLWNYVPGFDGLRVPARFAMVATLMLAVLGALGASVLARLRHGAIVLAFLAAAFLFEAGAAPFVVNGMTPVRGFVTPPARLQRPQRAPEIYKAVGRLPADAVLADLPLGQPDYDLRAMYYSIDRWRPVLNGYSGFFPPHYARATVMLGEVPRHVGDSVAMLRALGATHVIVHEGAYLDAEGRDTTASLRAVGAVEVFRDGADVLLALH
ncbi:MAG TPA: hypothetical protein VN654_17100 [Vicinamibacterales bacterium]|jgi:hypothetical protein|nr:hypothetical protein [Vicinamibacterales bacterium]